MHDLGQIQGPVILQGDPILSQRTGTLELGVGLPNENPGSLNAGDLGGNVANDVDVLNVFDDGSAAGKTGILSSFTNNLTAPAGTPEVPDYSNGTLLDQLTGMNMGANLTLNQGSPAAPSLITFPGGITYHGFEAMELMMGQGDDNLTINDTMGSADPATDAAHPTLTAVHGGGGSDHITVTNRSGPLVVYGDTSRDGVRYSANTIGAPDPNATPFHNPGNDTIDARQALQSVVIYGGDGNDTIWGSQAGDQIAGGAGDDEIHGQGGDDQIYGDSSFNVADTRTGFERGRATHPFRRDHRSDRGQGHHFGRRWQ